MATPYENRLRNCNRMDKPTFVALLEVLKEGGGLKDSLHICAGEKLVIYIHILKGNINRPTCERWRLSGAPCNAFLLAV